MQYYGYVITGTEDHLDNFLIHILATSFLIDCTSHITRKESVIPIFQLDDTEIFEQLKQLFSQRIYHATLQNKYHINSTRPRILLILSILYVLLLRNGIVFFEGWNIQVSTYIQIEYDISPSISPEKHQTI